jgi:hypothetical protein
MHQAASEMGRRNRGQPARPFGCHAVIALLLSVSLFLTCSPRLIHRPRRSIALGARKEFFRHIPIRRFPKTDIPTDTFLDHFCVRLKGLGLYMSSRSAGASRTFHHPDHNDPLYQFHQWQANLRILEATEIKSIPYVPLSHPFVERLIGTLRREYWITRCSGRRQISKTSCSISGPISTTIARIPHSRGERRIQPCHDQ